MDAAADAADDADAAADDAADFAFWNMKLFNRLVKS